MTQTQGRPGYLLLEDGRQFEGEYLGPDLGGCGEIVFTTVHAGYQEVLTDPSFAGQIVVMTAPMMGVYGTHREDDQSRRPWAAGFVVRHLSGTSTPRRADEPLTDYLLRHEVPCLVGGDTRAMTRHIRERGAMRAVMGPTELPIDRARERLLAEPEMSGRDLASRVGCPEPYERAAAGEERGLVICLDYGVKSRSLELLQQRDFRVRVVPSTAAVDELLAARPCGVFVSNGPGDPEAVAGATQRIRALSDAGLPIFGICLGHQLVARAFGGHNFKLPYGHRGGNHPVLNLETGAVEITSQNHGFAVLEEDGEIAGAPELRITHRNLNDGTVEGLAHRERPIFAVQYHPESAPGPHDSRYLFDRFVDVITEMSKSQEVDTLSRG